MRVAAILALVALLAPTAASADAFVRWSADGQAQWTLRNASPSNHGGSAWFETTCDGPLEVHGFGRLLTGPYAGLYRLRLAATATPPTNGTAGDHPCANIAREYYLHHDPREEVNTILRCNAMECAILGMDQEGPRTRALTLHDWEETDEAYVHIDLAATVRDRLLSTP